MLFTGVRVPSGSWNTLLDGLPVGMNACLMLSFIVPTCDVAPLLAMADGMEPLRTLFLIACTWLVMSRKLVVLMGGGYWSCSSTWQGGGVASDKIA